jgi:hypothetical protein
MFKKTRNFYKSITLLIKRHQFSENVFKKPPPSHWKKPPILFKSLKKTSGFCKASHHFKKASIP